MMLRTPVCSYPIIVSHLSFNFLCLLLLYSIYLNVWYAAGVIPQSHSMWFLSTLYTVLCTVGFIRRILCSYLSAKIRKFTLRFKKSAQSDFDQSK
jgi:hypothetical protein